MRTEMKIEQRHPPSTNSDAAFLGWQETLSGEYVPLFNIVAEGHSSFHSTVTETTLRRLRLRVPRTSSPYPDTGPPPWQNVGIELNHPMTSRNAIQTALLDYTVVKNPLKLNTDLQQDVYATMRTDTGDVLGIVRESYQPIQNRDAFAFFDTLVKEQEAVYDTAGVFGRGECVWILAKLPGFIKVNGNDIVNKYLLLTNSHDGSPQVRVRVTPIRVVCNNTLTSALQGVGELCISHTLNTAEYLEQALTTFGMSSSVFEQLDVMFNRMAAKKISEHQLREYVQALVPDNEEAENTARTEAIRNSVLRLHDSGQGAYLARGSLWGAFNSVTEYTDHIMSDGDSATHLNSIWFGRGEQLKMKAFNLAEDMLRA